MKRSITTIASIALLALTPTVFAAGGSWGASSEPQSTVLNNNSGENSGKANGFGKLDANSDGFISENEAKDAPEFVEYFQQVDVDADGKVTESEFSQFETTEMPANKSNSPSTDSSSSSTIQDNNSLSNDAVPMQEESSTGSRDNPASTTKP